MASAGAALSFTATSYARIIGANDRIAIGLIGCGGRGYLAHMPGIHPHDKQQNAEFTAVADPWRIRRQRAAARCQEWYGRPARQFVSYRDLLAEGRVDAVMIASCDHQHTTHLEAAARARKDAYCEKPLSMDMESLRQACDAVQAAGIVCQIGTQVRSLPTSVGCRELFRSGAIGKVSRIEQCRNGTQPYWYSRLQDVKAEDVDWPEFLMNRPMRPFDGKLLSGWYGYREFSDGPISGFGAHFIDLLNFIVGSTLPTSCVAQGGTFTWNDENHFTAPDHSQATWIYPDGFLVSYSTNFGNGSGSVLKIYGQQGVIDLTKWLAPTISGAGAIRPGKLGSVEKPVLPIATPDHFLDWLQCIRSRKTCHAPIEAGYNHCVPLLMAKLAMDSGQRQVYDAATREIRPG
jgi:predicted dehydrogenase